MRKLLSAIAAIGVLMLALGPDTAEAWGRGHVYVGVGPWWWGPPWPAYYPYPYPQPVIVEREPPVYIQGPAAPAEPPQPYYWYYCEGSKTYYPYVQECPGGWMKVVPPTTPAAPGP